jgi:hypothetical protein
MITDFFTGQVWSWLGVANSSRFLFTAAVARDVARAERYVPPQHIALSPGGASWRPLGCRRVLPVPPSAHIYRHRGQ